MLSEGLMFWEDGKVVGIAVRIESAIAKYREKMSQEPEFVEISMEDWDAEMEGMKVCGMPVRCERAIPKNVIYVGRRLVKGDH
jgi:hypothetical protein